MSVAGTSEAEDDPIMSFTDDVFPRPPASLVKPVPASKNQIKNATRKLKNKGVA